MTLNVVESMRRKADFNKESSTKKPTEKKTEKKKKRVQKRRKKRVIKKKVPSPNRESEKISFFSSSVMF